MNLIAAADLNWNIGNAGDLLCHIPEDLKYFKQMTTGKTVIMGRKTLESLPGGRPLPGRRNIVLTRNRNYGVEGAEVCHSSSELELLTADTAAQDLFVIGGAEIYKALLPLCSRAYITRIHHQFEADTALEPLDKLPGWRLSAESETFESAKGWKYSFLTYERC